MDMAFQCRLLEKSDLNDVLSLFLECFENDHYYVDLFGHSLTVNEICMFRPVILYCISSGVSYGCFDGVKLIGLSLCFPYLYTLNHHPDMIVEIFGETSDGELVLQHEMHDVLQSLKNEVIFQIAVAVVPEYRRIGIASSLISSVLTCNEDYCMASDVSNVSSLAIYQARNFSLTKLSDDYYLVLRRVE